MVFFSNTRLYSNLEKKNHKMISQTSDDYDEPDDISIIFAAERSQQDFVVAEPVSRWRKCWYWLCCGGVRLSKFGKKMNRKNEKHKQSQQILAEEYDGHFSNVDKTHLKTPKYFVEKEPDFAPIEVPFRAKPSANIDININTTKRITTNTHYCGFDV